MTRARCCLKGRESGAELCVHDAHLVVGLQRRHADEIADRKHRGQERKFGARAFTQDEARLLGNGRGVRQLRLCACAPHPVRKAVASC